LRVQPVAGPRLLESKRIAAVLEAVIVVVGLADTKRVALSKMGLELVCGNLAATVTGSLLSLLCVLLCRLGVIVSCLAFFSAGFALLFSCFAFFSSGLLFSSCFALSSAGFAFFSCCAAGFSSCFADFSGCACFSSWQAWLSVPPARVAPGRTPERGYQRQRQNCCGH